RRLGEHTALTAFRPIRREMDSGRMLAAAKLFARARYEWLPVPIGYEERFPRFVERATALDTLLEGPGSRKLFREIFKEITELDRHAQAHTQDPSARQH